MRWKKKVQTKTERKEECSVFVRPSSSSCLRCTFLNSAAARVSTQFCEFKFTSSELASNQNQLDPWTILSLFAVNS